MTARCLSIVCFVVGLAFLSGTASLVGATAGQQGWTIPATAKDEKNPLPVNDGLMANGKKLFAQKCQRCHGAEGKGDGPDADSDHAEGMDLTSPAKAAANPDGVVFYKIWHGRQSPRMPAFEDQLTKEQAWTIVAYVQTLRKK